MGSIPLPALDVRPPAAPLNPLDQYAKALQVQGQMQQNQMGSVQLQQAQQAQKDQKALGQLMIKNNGNLDKVIQDAPQAGVMPNTVLQLQQHNLQVKQAQQTYTEGQWKQSATAHDNAAGLIQPVLDAKTPEAKDAAYQAGLQAIQQNPQMYGITDPSQMPPPQRPPDDALKVQMAIHMGQKQQADQALKSSEIAKNTAQAGEAQSRAGESTANTNKIQAEMAFYQKQGLAPGVPLDAQEAASWLKQNPGKTPADFMKMKAGLTAQSNATAQAGLLSDSAKQMAAQNYATTGQLPGGMRSPGMAAGILNTAAGGPAGIPNVAANKANYHADSGSLASLQKNFDSVSAFENTAIKNLDQVAQAGAAIPDLSARFANVPVRKISAQMIGTPEMARFKTALLSAQSESAKILNSANASGVLSDSARHEAQEVLDGNLPYPAMMASINQLKTDFGNRHQSYAAQIADIQGRIGGKPAANAPATPTGKVLTQAQIQQAAKDHGVSVDEAARQAKAAGYQIQ